MNFLTPLLQLALPPLLSGWDHKIEDLPCVSNNFLPIGKKSLWKWETGQRGGRLDSRSCGDKVAEKFNLKLEIREGFTKNNAKKSGDLPNLGGGVTPNQTLFLKKKKFFQGPHRTILGHPKHVLHLVPSPNAIAKAFNVM